MSVQVSPNSTISRTLPEHRRTFLESLAARGESERNIAAHGLGIDRFAEYLAPRPPEEAGPGDLESFLSYLSELGVTAESLKTYRTVVQHWVLYLGEKRVEDQAAAVAAESVEDSAASSNERLPSPTVAAFSRTQGEADENCSSLLLSGLRPTSTPQAAKKKADGSSVPVCEPDPTTPMMPAVTPAFVETEQAAAASEPFAPAPSPAFEPLDPEPPAPAESAFEALDPEPPAPDVPSFEPLDPEPPAADVPSFEPLDPEPPAADVPSFEPLDPEPPAREVSSFEPLDPEPPAREVSSFEPLDPEPSAPDVPSFEPLDPEPPASSASAFEPIEAEVPASFESFEDATPCDPAPSLSDLPVLEADAGFGGLDDEEASVSVPVFGDLSEGPADAPVLADENAAAEERDRARFQAPPLPQIETAPPAAIPGDTEFEGSSASIPLAGGILGPPPTLGESTEGGFRAPSERPTTLDPTGGEMQTQPGTGKWGMRRPQGERTDLSLDEVISMALSGELGSKDLVRKPSGEWVPAADLRPLRRALGLDGGPSTAVRQVRDDLALGRAAAGIVIAGLGSGLLWWFMTLAVGVELVPLAILGGLLGGIGARAAARRPAIKVGLVGAAAAPMSVLVGRYLVFETVSSGVVLEGLQDVGGFGSFMGSSLGVTQLVCLGLGALAGLLMGSIGGR